MQSFIIQPRVLKKKKKEKKNKEKSESSSSKTSEDKETKKPKSKSSSSSKKARPKRDKTIHHPHADERRPRGQEHYSCDIVDFNNGVIAAFSTNMCNAWIPGSGEQSEICSAQETRQGGAVCSLAAQCMLQGLEQEANISIVIAHSGIAQRDIQQGLLPYDEFRTVFPSNEKVFGVVLNGGSILDVLEDALEAVSNGDAEAYPCTAGIRYTVDMTAAKGSRLSNVQIRVSGTHDDIEWVALDRTSMYLVATTQSLLEGNHGYKTFSSIEDDVIDLNESFYNLFTGCAATNCPFSEMQASQYSTQQFITGQ